MVAPKILTQREAETKLLQALTMFLALKFSTIVLCSLAAIVVVLYFLSVLLTAFFTLCTQIASVYAACNPLEKLLVFFLAWALLAWGIRLYRSIRHATI